MFTSKHFYWVLRSLLAASVALILAGCNRAASPNAALAPPPAAEFAGSESCAVCHAAQTAAWRDSQHHGAMQPATRDTVLADFGGVSYRHAGITTTFAQRDGRFIVRTDGPDGALTDFEVAYTFALAPLQQYLVELPGGRWQALGHAWDSRPRQAGGQRWFHLYPSESLRAGDPLHWTGPQQNWNFMCADCHTTNLRKRYDASSRRYATTWSELGVGCEACHGAGSNHIAWAGQPKEWPQLASSKGLAVALTERAGVSWMRDPKSKQPRRSAPLDTKVELEVCARCHARRSQLTDAVTAADSLHDGFVAALIEPGLFYADGQMRDEVFNYGSFLQSRMHAAGVTCSDCHEPHSGALRTSGDAVCFQCHENTKYSVADHHFHAPGSEGSRCTSCHMPTTTYMMIDPRHDHSFRIPRPEVSAAVGSPDACTNCHQDRDRDWASAEIRKRYPQPNPGFQGFGEAFSRLERGASGASLEVAAIATDPAQPPIVRASAWQRLVGHPVAVDPLRLGPALNDADPLVRRGAAIAAAALDPDTRVRLMAPLLSDPVRSVRLEAVSHLLDIPPNKRPTEAFERALTEYVASQRFNGDRPESQINLGELYASQGDFDAALAAFEEAIALNPAYLPAYVNLADLYRARGDEVAAEKLLREALPHAGLSGTVHHALGLSLVRQRRVGESLAWLAEASRREPSNARFALVYAVALHETGSLARANQQLEGAISRNPEDESLHELLDNYRRQ